MVKQTSLERIIHLDQLDALNGEVRISPSKVIWLGGHLIVAAIGCTLTIGPETIAVFLVTTLVTLLFGHSLGMHRLLIHRSYACRKWIEYLFVHLGVLVGMAVPIGMVKAHDTRDWAQRQDDCHSFLRHGQGFFQDGWWQLFCDVSLKNGPDFRFEEAIATDRVYLFMERTWMLQQLPLGILLFIVGGMPFVIWGISARVVVSVGGHWVIGYFAHNHGGEDHEIVGAAVQGRNVPWTSYLTMGESWHNNHHAYPGSAMLGLYHDQPDPGWTILNAMHNLGFAWDIKLPQDLPHRPELRSLTHRAKTRPSRQTKPCPILGFFGAT